MRGGEQKSYADTLANEGLPVPTIMKRLGHCEGGKLAADRNRILRTSRRWRCMPSVMGRAASVISRFHARQPCTPIALSTTAKMSAQATSQHNTARGQDSDYKCWIRRGPLAFARRVARL